MQDFFFLSHLMVDFLLPWDWHFDFHLHHEERREFMEVKIFFSYLKNFGVWHSEKHSSE
jgi:hypothetical protein